ncbi:hypothetical protein YQE_11996, partial [Dendroctonus ponderosae]
MMVIFANATLIIQIIADKLPPPICLLFKSKENICAVAENLAKEAEDVLRNSLTRDCCKQLESVLLAISPNCRVYPFGSRVSGLGNKDSDLDVFVDMDEDYFGKKFQDAKKQTLHRNATRLSTTDSTG